MSEQKSLFIFVLLTVFLISGCSQYSTSDYLELEDRYKDLQYKYESLESDYDYIKEEYSDYMTPTDVMMLSDFAHNNPFHSTGFYSTAYSVVLKTGGTATVRIGFDAYGTLYYEPNNNCVSVEWRDWDEDGRAPLVLTGKQQGITYLTISNDADDRTFDIVVFVVD